MGPIMNEKVDLGENFSSPESFYEWFLEVQSKLLEEPIEDLKQEDEEYFKNNSEDDDEISLDQKRKIEKVKKYLEKLSNLDIFLELSEDNRTGSDFVTKFCSLEAFAVLGATAFFNAYLKRESDTFKSLEVVQQFLTKCQSVHEIGLVKGMENALQELKYFCNKQFKRKHDNNSNGVDTDAGLINKSQIVISGIKMHFLSNIFDEFLCERESILDQILQKDPENQEWNLNKYYITRVNHLKIKKEGESKNLPSDEEKKCIETGFRNNSENPKQMLAVCQYLSDFLAGNGPIQLKFVDKQFNKHSEIVTFIRDTSIEILEKFPSFLRAYFTFADLFATELPITRQDREYAKSILDKALKANPNSSKINHKMGLFLIKGRQFVEAKNYFLKSTELDPLNVLAFYDLVKLLLRDPTGINKEFLESVFNDNSSALNERFGPENEIPFWKGCYFFITGDRDVSVTLWVEIILQFYVSKPELDLESVLPFKVLPKSAQSFLWTRTPLTLTNVKNAVSGAINQEKTRRRVVFQRLIDIVNEAIEVQQ